MEWALNLEVNFPCFPFKRRGAQGQPGERGNEARLGAIGGIVMYTEVEADSSWSSNDGRWYQFSGNKSMDPARQRGFYALLPGSGAPSCHGGCCRGHKLVWSASSPVIPDYRDQLARICLQTLNEGARD